MLTRPSSANSSSRLNYSDLRSYFQVFPSLIDFLWLRLSIFIYIDYWPPFLLSRATGLLLSDDDMKAVCSLMIINGDIQRFRVSGSEGQSNRNLIDEWRNNITAAL
jgi:hypothetical protein